MKKFTLEDFHSKTNQENPSKMPLLMDGEDTGCYLLVKGMSARSVAQAKLESQIAYARIEEAVSQIEDEIEKRVYEKEEQERVQNKFACALVSGWSFSNKCTEKEKANLFDEQEGLSSLVISHAAESKEYMAKK